MNKISVYLNTLRLKGYLAYEYNPFHNYLTNVDLYESEGFLIPAGSAINKKNGLLLTKKDDKWVDNRGNVVPDSDIIIGKETNACKLFAKAGSLIDLDTDKLKFDLEHPVDIQVQPSYDGSVNLIINDDKNIPRLINSRFSVREKSTYEIVDRIGENDTNIYNSETFDKDTSLYFLYSKNPLINFEGIHTGGNLKVGNYAFYFTYCDADNNESDIIAETGVIPVFMGGSGDPFSMEGGIKNLNTHKLLELSLANMDKSYNYFKVYYIRYFADYQLNRVVECKKIYQRYPIKSSLIKIQITGNEEVEDLDPSILNITKFNPKSILTLALCKNMLFFGNIVKNSDNYKELTDCALRIVPEIYPKKILNFDNEYYAGGTGGYYNPRNIYDTTGYFNNEYYRFGVVFIYENGTLSNVYNTLGGTITSTFDSTNETTKVENNISYNPDSLFSAEGAFLRRKYIEVDDFGWIKNENKYFTTDTLLNSKGVCKLNLVNTADIGVPNDIILGVKFNIPEEVAKFLKEDLGIRGFFFVRQKRVPNLLAQCYLMPMDEQLDAPVLEVYDENAANKTYVTECFVSQGKKKNLFENSPFKVKNPPTIIVDDRLVVNNYTDRLYQYKSESAISKRAYAGICPDFLLNQPYYNLIFNGNKFKIRKVTTNYKLFNSGTRYYNTPNETNFINSEPLIEATICTVTEDVPTVAIKNLKYRLKVGETEEAFRFSYCEVDKGASNTGSGNEGEVNKATNIVRGMYSPYLAIYSTRQLETGELYDIYLELDGLLSFLTRMNSSEPFYAISDRYNFEQVPVEDLKVGNKQFKKHVTVCWRGDCYINTFTYRLNRNFNDPSLPSNDDIIDAKTWKDNYDVLDSTKWSNISRSDLNAVLMGSWITFKVKSYMNYALRSQDHSYVSEEALMGSPRSYYPRSSLMWRGTNKLPDSYVFNDAFRASLGYKCYFGLLDINYLKDTFSNRIQYSAIAIQDSFKNNYRESLSTYFRDYSMEYGSIQKIIGFEGYLLVVLEHGIGIATVNERVLAGTGDGEPVYINTQNVLPEELTIISDTYGSQWPESVIKSEAGYVYGVDTIAKKIWRVRGETLEILSDFKVNKFLIENISLGERETSPIIGLRNVKTHYNNNKKDVMFTFYDDLYKDEEKVWNICFNEILGMFVTFYSWVPSYSDNIDTLYFSFNRLVSKELTLLDKSNYNKEENSGILVDSPILQKGIIIEKINGSKVIHENYASQLHYIQPQITSAESYDKEDFAIQQEWKEISCDFELVQDHWKNNEWFDIEEIDKEIGETSIKYSYVALKTQDFKKDGANKGELYKILEDTCISKGIEISKYAAYVNLSEHEVTNIEEALMHLLKLRNQRTILLYLLATQHEDSNPTSGNTGLEQYLDKVETVAVTFEDIVKNNDGTKRLELKEDPLLIPDMFTDFFLHGRAGIFDLAELRLRPTYWYGEQHPFEFEFVVNDKVGQLKIFNNLLMISNKAEPESFHFEIEGDNYEFSSDKRNMYYRQERTKAFEQEAGLDVIYDRNYKWVKDDSYTQEQFYRKKGYIPSEEKTSDRMYPQYEKGLVQQEKSTIFPLYYERTDTFNDIYHAYTLMNGKDTYEYKNLSGSEIVWDKDLNQFDIVTHIKNSPIDLYGRLRGNSRYKEGIWNILIPSIAFMQKNEKDWEPVDNPEPPIVINSDGSSTLTDTEYDILPEILGDDNRYSNLNGWSHRKETRIRDKWMKVRVRYSGKNLAVIHSLITLYNISLS